MNQTDEINQLDVFGKFLIANIRDSIISELEALISGKSLRLNSYEFAQKLANLSKEDLDNVRELITKSIDYSLSNFLNDLQSHKGQESAVRIMVGDTDIGRMKAFLQGELQGT
jgi:hypothetical protein